MKTQYFCRACGDPFETTDEHSRCPDCGSADRRTLQTVVEFIIAELDLPKLI